MKRYVIVNGITPEMREEMEAGATAYEVEDKGHTFTATPTDERGIDSGRIRWAVRCKTCDVLVHRGSTSVQAQIRHHLWDVKA